MVPMVYGGLQGVRATTTADITVASLNVMLTGAKLTELLWFTLSGTATPTLTSQHALLRPPSGAVSWKSETPGWCSPIF